MFDAYTLAELVGICRALGCRLNAVDLTERRQNRVLYARACRAYRDRLWNRT